LDARKDVRIAERIFAHAGTAVFFFRAQGATAKNPARSRSMTRNARISATGFRLMKKNTALKAQARGQITRKQQMQQGRHSIICLNNFAIKNHHE